MAKFRVRAALSAIAAGILITIGGCTEQAPTGNSGPETGAQFQRLELQQTATAGAAYDVPGAEKVIGTEGGTLEITGGHSLTFPAGALGQPTRIRARVDARYVQVDLEPHGINFPAGREPVLKLSYAAAAPVSAKSLTVVYLDQAGRVLENMNGTADASSRVVTARLPHFSKYAVASY